MRHLFVCHFPMFKIFICFKLNYVQTLVLKIFVTHVWSGDERIIYRELSNYILDIVQTFYLREEFYQTFRRKGFKENLSDFTPTKELNFFMTG